MKVGVAVPERGALREPEGAPSDENTSMQAIAFLVPAAAMLALAAGPRTPALACVLLTAALGASSLGQAGFVANMSDVAPGAAGAMFGLCNTFGSLAGVAGVAVTGAVVQATGGFAAVFMGTAGLYLVGAAAFWALARGEPQF